MGFSYRDGSKALLEADSVHWYAHRTEASAVDVAVTPFASARRDLLDLEPVPEHLFTSDQRIRNASIGVGDEITTVGVFTRFSYEDKRLSRMGATNRLLQRRAKRWGQGKTACSIQWRYRCDFIGPAAWAVGNI